MKVEVSKIRNVLYGQYNISSEPTKDDIEKAISENRLESRGFQADHTELIKEWNARSKNIKEYCDAVKKYHSERIAFFAVNKWNDPIILYEDGVTIKDGLHRLKAAIFLKLDTIEAINNK